MFILLCVKTSLLSEFFSIVGRVECQLRTCAFHFSSKTTFVRDPFLHRLKVGLQLFDFLFVRDPRVSMRTHKYLPLTMRFATRQELFQRLRVEQPHRWAGRGLSRYIFWGRVAGLLFVEV